MRKRKKIFAIALSALLMCTTLVSCSSAVTKVNQTGDIQEELPEADLDTTTAVLPTYDYTNLKTSSTLVSKEELQSYYRRELNTRCTVDYNDLYNGMTNCDSTIYLTKLISEEELFKLFSIINIDEPALFHVDTKYSYDLDENGYVYRVYPEYTMSKSEYTQKYKTMISMLQDFYSSIDITTENSTSGNEYSVEQLAIDYIPSISLDAPSSDADTSITSLLTAYSANSNANMYNVAKLFALYCRYVGLDCAVKIGKPTTDDLSELIIGSSCNFEDLSDIGKCTTVVDDTKREVDFDFNDYCFWNVVQIEGEWYNIDFALEEKASNQILLDYYDGETTSSSTSTFEDLGLCENVNDYTISMSRISYYTDNILGLSPACTDTLFQRSYREGTYVLSHTTSQMIQYLTKQIQLYRSSSDSKTAFWYQFEDEETYSEFIENFDEQMEAYNNENNNSVLDYKVIAYRPALAVYVCDLSFK